MPFSRTGKELKLKKEIMIKLPDKPKFNEPCNRCGLCCSLFLCPVGEIAFIGASSPCPALKISPDKKSTYCELFVAESVFDLESKILSEALGIGVGCSMED